MFTNLLIDFRSYQVPEPSPTLASSEKLHASFDDLFDDDNDGEDANKDLGWEKF